MYHGGGGFIHSEIYDMPIWLRRFHISRINDYVKKRNEEIEKNNKGQTTDSKQISRPNVNPSSTYNF